MSTQHPAAKRGQEVRQALMAAAVELIPEVGWGAVSTRLLATRAGVAPGLVHYHFSSVPALLREAATGVMRGLVTATVAALDDMPDAEAGLAAMLAALDTYDGTDPTSLLFTETYLAATRDPELHRELGGLMSEFTGTLARWLTARGVATPDQTAAVLAAAIDGIMLHRAVTPTLTGTAVRPVLSRLLAVQPTDAPTGGRS